MLAIVESRADAASVRVCDRLRDVADWKRREDGSRPDADGGGTWYRTDGAELRSFDALHLELERPVEAFECDPDLLVFASRHSGETGPLLTGHFTGNFGPAEYGGADGALAAACPNALAALLEAFDAHAPEGYEVGMECTHHGPTDVGVPSLFAELGSGEEQWDDPAGAEAVARAILELRGVSPHREKQVVGFGGDHYVPRYERVVRETPWAVGHVASDWALEAMGDPAAERDVLERAFAASAADLAVVEGDRPGLESAVSDLGYRVVSETWLREVGDRPLELVERVEDALGPVETGVRFGAVEADAFAVVDLPAELVAATQGIDPGAVREVLEARAIAFETTNGGSRVGERAAVPDAGPGVEAEGAVKGVADAGTDADAVLEGIVADLASILEAKYEAVRVTEDAVVVEERAFDPDRAREAGVPEGPKFGALAEGESVTVDGETVSPGDVHLERTRRFPI